MNNGYVEISMPNHARANNSNGCMYEHIYIMEEKINRSLYEGEVVHHLDGNRANNSIDNLVIFKTNADHARFHKTGEMTEIDNFIYVSIKKEYLCRCCGKELLFRKKICSECIEQKRNINLPPKQELEQLILDGYNFTEIGKIYGFSGSAVKKWLKKYNIYNKKERKSKDVIKKQLKLSREDVEFIFYNYIKGDKIFGARKLAKMFNITHSEVHRIVNKTGYKQYTINLFR